MSDGVLEFTIEELFLSVRAYNCLKRAGLDTVRKLIEVTEEDLYKIQFLGKVGVNEVIQKLASLNLHLKEPSIPTTKEFEWNDDDIIDEYIDEYDGVIDWGDDESYFESSSCSDVDSLSTKFNCEFNEVCSQEKTYCTKEHMDLVRHTLTPREEQVMMNKTPFQKKEYSFRFADGTIEVSAFNYKAAEILAKAEAIKKGWNYGLLKASVTHLDVLINWANFTDDEDMQFRQLLSKAREGNMYEETE